jgi:hypothetical protein
MRAQIPMALLAVILGALETAGAAQELVFRGIMQSETGPLSIGAIGTVAGLFLVATGIALLFRSPRVEILITATAWTSIPTFVISGIIYHYAGWPTTVVGIAFPLLLILLNQKTARTAPQRA